MSTPDHSSFDSAGLGAALEIFASAHEFPASVRAISVQAGVVYVFARRRRESDYSAQSCILELPADSILVLPDRSDASIQFRIAAAVATKRPGFFGTSVISIGGSIPSVRNARVAAGSTGPAVLPWPWPVMTDRSVMVRSPSIYS